MNEHHAVIIIGAGLSGLYTAWRLQQQGQDVVVLEARDRTGGRILSSRIGEHNDSCVDLGPAWVWPQLQPQLHKLVSELEISLFKQFTQGSILYESKSGQVERYAGPSSHEQSYRVGGGCIALIEALESQIPDSSLRLSTAVTSIDQQHLVINANCDGEMKCYTADKIIITIPPRLITQAITFEPPLDVQLLNIWSSIPTWMAGHCKVIFIYDQPFWRDQGLSGEVFSHCGPLTEIYDGSPVSEDLYALTSFVGISAQQRQQIQDQDLKDLCLSQIQRIFGDSAIKVRDIQIQDWSRETFTTSDMDLNTASNHPQYPGTSARSFGESHQIILAGTETARLHGGYLEGALESAEEALQKI